MRASDLDTLEKETGKQFPLKRVRIVGPISVVHTVVASVLAGPFYIDSIRVSKQGDFKCEVVLVRDYSPTIGLLEHHKSFFQELENGNDELANKHYRQYLENES